MNDTTNSFTWPSCSIIIPTRDAIEYLKPCVESVLASDYPGEMELIIIDNGSRCPDTLSYMKDLAERPDVHLLRIDEAFNFSRLNNLAVEQANGDVLCFLNNDIVAGDPQWLRTLVPVAAHPEVGAVGPVLLYPDGKVQHGGVSLDEDFIGRHIGQNLAFEELQARFVTEQCYPVDALTAAAMLTRRTVFQEIGGFDEERLPISFNDIDYCLKLQDSTRLVMLCPLVTLLHHESVSRLSDDLPENRRRAESERSVMQSRWNSQLLAWHCTGEVPWREKTGDPVQDEPLALEAVLLEARNGTRRLGDSRLLQSTGNPWKPRFQSLETRYREEQQDFASRIEDLEGYISRLEGDLVLKDGEIRKLEGDVETRIHELEKRQAELDAVYQSRSWRITRPLRWLTTARQRVGLALIRTRPGRALYYRLRPQRQPYDVPDPVKSPDEIKAQYSDHYRDELAEFLSSGEPLEFAATGRPDVSVILVLYNQAHLTLQCLLSLRDQCDTPMELIIVDNASADDTDVLLSRLRGPVQVIRNETNRGFVEAVNQGAGIANGELLLLLNNDATLHKGAIEAATRHFRTGSRAGAVGGRIILLDGTLQEAGSIIWNDGSCAGYGRGDHPDRPEYRFVREVDYCSGAFLMTPARLFHSLGGFDLDYAPAYYEETDYCIRLQKAGYSVMYEPRATITHYEFASSGGFSNASKLQQLHREVLKSKHGDFLASRLDPSGEHSVLRARNAGSRKRMLIVDDRVPDPAMGSGYPRANDIARLVTGLGFDVTHYPLTCPDETWDTVYRLLPHGVETILHSGISGLGDFLTTRASYYDVILISREHNMRLFSEAVSRYGVDLSGSRIIYDAEALTASREIHRLRLAGRPLSDARQQRMVEDELGLAASADLVVAVNEQEAEQFRKAGMQAAVLGHCIPVRLTPSDFEDREGFLFVGALRENESPNVDSVLWFAEEVMPHIEHMMENPPTVHVVGDDTASALRAIDNPNVQLLGPQPDLTRYYDRCRVFIAPTRFAAGIPHKIHEAAAHGVPVCATELLAGQLGWDHGRELLAASDAASFAAQCVWLYSDGNLWREIRSNAARAMVAECSEAAFRERLMEITTTERDTP